MFYSYLNDKSDEFLEAHNYSRDEIKVGMKEITGPWPNREVFAVE